MRYSESLRRLHGKSAVEYHNDMVFALFPTPFRFRNKTAIFVYNGDHVITMVVLADRRARDKE